MAKSCCCASKYYPHISTFQVGIEDCLHIEFEYNKSKFVAFYTHHLPFLLLSHLKKIAKNSFVIAVALTAPILRFLRYHLNDIVIGKIFFLLVKSWYRWIIVEAAAKLIGFGPFLLCFLGAGAHKNQAHGVGNRQTRAGGVKTTDHSTSSTRITLSAARAVLSTTHHVCRSGSNVITENETMSKFEIMDGAPVRGSATYLNTQQNTLVQYFATVRGIRLILRRVCFATQASRFPYAYFSPVSHSCQRSVTCATNSAFGA